MKLNRKLVLVLALLVSIAMATTGTLAYLTDTDEAVNVMTLGNVDIEQLENGKPVYGFENGQPLYPAYMDGATVVGKLDKVVTVENTGNSDAFVRTWIAFEAGELTPDNFDDIIHAEINEVDYELSSATIETIAGVKYYVVCATYNKALPAGEITEPSLKSVYMDPNAGNADVAQFGGTYEILVCTQAVQTTNLGELGAKGALIEGFGEDHPWTDWNGTSSEPAGNIIASKADLMALSGKTVDGTYTLMANIDLAGEDFKAMNVKGAFVLNGNGYTISNVNLVPAPHSGMGTIGLFHMANEVSSPQSLTVNDLTIKNATITAATSGYSDAAVIVGYNTISDAEITLHNVDVVNANINNPIGNAAGLVGYTVGKVNLNGCDVTGTVAGERTDKTGAYVGTANTAGCVVTITNCTNGTEVSDIGRVINGATETGATYLVEANDDLAAIVEEGKTNIKLGAGTYTIPAAVAGKTMTISGSGENTVLDFTKVNNVGNATITFENLTIKGVNANTMSGYGIQSTTGEIVYKNCTFVDAVTNEYYGSVVYENCTFTGTYYITTYAVESATFKNCTFDRTDSRAILVYSHGNNPLNVLVEGCTFKADAQGYTGAGDWTAAVEVDTTNIKTAGTTVTINNCTHDANYSGIVRDKSAAGATPAVIIVDGVEIN